MAMEQNSDFSSAVAFFGHERMTWTIISISHTRPTGHFSSDGMQGSLIFGLSYLTKFERERREGKGAAVLWDEIEFECLQEGGLLEITESTFSYLQVILW